MTGIGGRGRRFYKVAEDGRQPLTGQRETWTAFVEAVRHITGDGHA